MKNILVTGVAGFIGYHFAKRLSGEKDVRLITVDSINDYYDTSLKINRLRNLGFKDDKFTIGQNYNTGNISFYRTDLKDKAEVEKVFNDNKIDYIIHLAAQAGVRYSLSNPYAYIDSNILSFLNILENARNHSVKHLIFASSSSVYGMNEKMPFSVSDNVDHPIALYGATKKANELMAHSYAHLFRIPVTGLRFFTVYGPWGRPDMALSLFTRNIFEDKPIEVFNNGDMIRDFTYIDDIIESLVRLIDNIPVPDPDFNGKSPEPSTSSAPYRIYNIGNHSPVNLMDFIRLIELETGRKAKMNFREMQPGDVPASFADVTSLYNIIGFKPDTPIKKGIHEYVKWYREYYKV